MATVQLLSGYPPSKDWYTLILYILLVIHTHFVLTCNKNDISFPFL